MIDERYFRQRANENALESKTRLNDACKMHV